MNRYPARSFGIRHLNLNPIREHIARGHRRRCAAEQDPDLVVFQAWPAPDIKIAGPRPRMPTQSAAEESARERLVFGLRRLEGVDRERFALATGFEIDQLVGEPLRKFVRSDLLEDTGARIRLTRQGLLVSDSIWPEFLSR